MRETNLKLNKTTRDTNTHMNTNRKRENERKKKFELNYIEKLATDKLFDTIICCAFYHIHIIY